MSEARCPADPAHGVMVELFGSGLWYCYDCRHLAWLRQSLRMLQVAKEADHVA